MVQNLFKFREQTLIRHLDLKGYLTTLVLNIPISASHCKMPTDIAPKGYSNEWVEDNPNSFPHLNITITERVITNTSIG